MSNYILFTDSACDIAQSVLEKWGVSYIELSFTFEDSDKVYTNYGMPTKEFYQRMRDGGVAKTSAINVDAFINAFEPYLQAGSDVLYLAFSSGLSGTYNASRIAAEQLSEKYPQRKVITVDTLCASSGQGLLVKFALDLKNGGASMEEVAAYVEENRLKLSHWFTVDDLEYLKRGGRVSPAVALIGGVLGIKPVMHVDNEGHLVKVTTARGRKAALKAIATQFEKTVIDPKMPIYISQAECNDDAKKLSKMIHESCGAKVELINDIGPVIGAHAGPGTIALFFIASER